jgi:hypothetical protein
VAKGVILDFMFLLSQIESREAEASATREYSVVYSKFTRSNHKREVAVWSRDIKGSQMWSHVVKCSKEWLKLCDVQ